MWLIILLLFLQFGPRSGDDMLRQSRKQADYYILQIDRGRYTDEYLWALTVLSTENETIKDYVESSIQKRGISSGPLLLFADIAESTPRQLQRVVFETGSADLLIALLLTDLPQKKEILRKFLSQYSLPESESVDYRQLSKTIIREETVSEQMLTTKKFRLSHFFLISDQNKKQYLSVNYLKNLSEYWKNNFSSSYSNQLQLPLLTYFQAVYLTDRYDQINTFYTQLKNNRLFPNSPLKLRIYRYIDYSMYRLGQYDKSLEIVREFTLPLVRAYGDKKTELQVLLSQGVYLYSIGKLHKAKEIYTQVLQEANAQDIPINRSSLYNNLGITYLKLGNYDQYLDLQFQALETAQKQENPQHQLDIYINLFVYYQRAKNQKDALSYLEKAEEIAVKLNSSADLGKVYTFLGFFHKRFTKDYEKAHSYYQQAEAALDPKNDSRQFIYLLNEQAKAYEQQGKFEQALATHDRILKLAAQKDSPVYIDGLVNKALIYLKMNRLSRARKLIKDFETYELGQLDFNQVVKANTVKADYLSRAGHPAKALDILSPTIDQIVKRAKGSTDLKTGYWHVADEYLDAFDLTVSIHLQNGRPKAAVALLDQLKTINDASIYQNSLVRASLLTESELTRYKNITNRLDQKRKQFLTATGDEKFAVRQDINELELEKRKLDRKISSQTDAQPATVSEVQSQLAGRELVLHITELKNKYYIARISRSDVSVKKVTLNEKIRNLFSASTEQIANHETDLTALYSISQLLGLKDLPDRIANVTIIPDSYLYQLPIDVLPLEKPAHSYSYGSARYFIEKYTTRYLTSLNDFNSDDDTRGPSDYKWDFTGYGVSDFAGYNNQNLVPLPYASKEVESIKSKLTELADREIFSGRTSQKSSFTETAPKSRILHLATHSEISERDPLFSSIYLSNEADGADSSFSNQLFAYELFELNLNNEMIMLNSCQSGSGPYIQGTGIMGFSRALQYAGAGSLVLNTWSVNDMLASEFAIYFYGQLNRGKSKAEALHNTKLHFLETQNASPHFWGPYMLIGNSGPIVQPNRNMNLAVAGAFMTFFLLFVILSSLKEMNLLFFERL